MSSCCDMRTIANAALEAIANKVNGKTDLGYGYSVYVNECNSWGTLGAEDESNLEMFIGYIRALNKDFICYAMDGQPIAKFVLRAGDADILCSEIFMKKAEEDVHHAIVSAIMNVPYQMRESVGFTILTDNRQFEFRLDESGIYCVESLCNLVKAEFAKMQCDPKFKGFDKTKKTVAYSF